MWVLSDQVVLKLWGWSKSFLCFFTDIIEELIDSSLFKSFYSIKNPQKRFTSQILKKRANLTNFLMQNNIGRIKISIERFIYKVWMISNLTVKKLFTGFCFIYSGWWFNTNLHWSDNTVSNSLEKQILFD